MQLHAGAICKLLYGIRSVHAIIHLLKLADYLPLQRHKPCDCCYQNFTKENLLPFDRNPSYILINYIFVNLFLHIWKNYIFEASYETGELLIGTNFGLD